MNEKQIKDANAYIAKIKRQRQILENLKDRAHGTFKGYEAGCRCYRCKLWKYENGGYTDEFKVSDK